MESIAYINTALLLGSLLVLTGIFSSLIATRIGSPLLLVFLGIGMLAGEDGLGQIQFDNYHLAYLIGSIALAIILFDGGLRSRVSGFKGALAPSITLATVGVVLTTILVAIPTMFLLGWTPLESLLLGAIVASTDTAAVFFLIRAFGLKLRQKIGATLEIESGTNDPIAVFLTIILIEIIATGAEPSFTNIGAFLQQLFLGGVLGVAGGFAALSLLSRIDLPNGLHPLFVATFVLLTFSITAKLDGSGFLAVYIVGLILGNNPIRAYPNIIKFHDAITWLSQIVMFIILGLLVTPTELVQHAPKAIFIAVFLIFVARPIAVWLCLTPFKFNWREKAFVSWVGLRGAVSIFLAAIPMLSGLPHAELYFNIAFFVVLVSLVLQGWSIKPIAKTLKIVMGTPVLRTKSDVPITTPKPGAFELAEYSVPNGCEVLTYGVIPSWANLVRVVREGQNIEGEKVEALQVGDYAYFLVKPDQIQLLDNLFLTHDDLMGAEPIFKKLSVRAKTTLSELSETCGVKFNDDDALLTIEDVFIKYASSALEVGTKVSLNSSHFIATRFKGGRLDAADLLIEKTYHKPPLLTFIQSLFKKPKASA